MYRHYTNKQITKIIFCKTEWLSLKIAPSSQLSCLPTGHLVVAGDISGGYDLQGVGTGVGATGIYWVEARDPD